MGDKVLAIVRETLLHENSFVDIVLHPQSAQATITFLQCDERYQYPDHLLKWTLDGLVSCSMRLISPDGATGETIQGIDCELENSVYMMSIKIGRRLVAGWILEVHFLDLRYERSPAYL